MEQLFIGVLNNAITVSALIIAIIVVRAFGKKMPKWIACMLWMTVAIKLVVPIQFESVLSLIPSGKPIPTNISMETNPQISSGISSVDEIVNPVISRSFTPDQVASVNPLQILFHIGALGWLAGMSVMLIYALITYILIRKRVSTSVKIDSKVYECDDISDSFILGTISPKVYLPSSLSDEARGYILKHEFAHLDRRDYIWKPFGFLILSVYWFNPLCWIAYILLCKDIEYACDEKVTKNIEKGEKAEYCRVLLENSMPRNMISACPVAFGGTDVKDRIKNIVNYKKPAFWITLASIMVCAVVGVCFATSRNTNTTSEQQTVKLAQAQAENQEQTPKSEKSVWTRLYEGDETAADPKLELKETTDPKIIDFINKFYEAQASGDIETLKGMQKDLSEYSELRTKAMADHIEKYDSFNIYNQPGPHEGTNIVYVFNTVKYKEYDKPIPECSWFYIYTDENGELHVNDNIADEATKEEGKHIDLASMQPSVLKVYKKYPQVDNDTYEKVIIKLNNEVAEQIKAEVNKNN